MKSPGLHPNNQPSTNADRGKLCNESGKTNEFRQVKKEGMHFQEGSKQEVFMEEVAFSVRI